MADIQKELAEAIEEIALETNMTVKEVIRQAIEILEEEGKDETANR